jgi:4-hydroxy-tetrahydrodipicolinate reductase
VQVTPRNLAIIGMGRMGRAIQELAPAMGWNVCATFDADGSAGGTGITAQTLNGADAAVEFTEPPAATSNARACISAGCPVVVGTTGWYDALPVIEREVERSGGALLWAPNFSLGVNVLDELTRAAGALLAGAEAFDAHVVETHHSGKKDSPSGTAAMLHKTLAGALGRETGVTSIRIGSVPGTHEVVFDGPFEQLVLRHEARDRRVFAAGALAAAAWLVGRKGVFTMRDVLQRSDS